MESRIFSRYPSVTRNELSPKANTPTIPHIKRYPPADLSTVPLPAARFQQPAPVEQAGLARFPHSEGSQRWLPTPRNGLFERTETPSLFADRRQSPCCDNL